MDQVLAEALDPLDVNILEVSLVIGLGGCSEHHEGLVRLVEVFLGLDLSLH